MEVFRRAPLLYRGAGGRKRGGDLVVHQGGQPARVGRRSRRLGDLLAPAATATSPPLVELFAGESKLRSSRKLRSSTKVVAPHPARYVDIMKPGARRCRIRSRGAVVRRRGLRLHRRVLHAHRLGEQRPRW